MPENTKQIFEANDLRKSAIHECGHACVTRHYGMGGSPAIWRNDNDNFMDEMLWFATTIYDGAAITPLRLRRVAIAGIMAEEISNFEVPSDCDEQTLAVTLESSFGEYFDDSEGCSKSDWEGARGWTSGDLHAVYVILMRKWRSLLEEAEALIEVASKSGSAISNPPEESQCSLPKVGPGGQTELNVIADQCQNVLRLKVARTTSASILVVSSKTRLKLTIIDRARKERLFQDVFDVASRAMFLAFKASHSNSNDGDKIKFLIHEYIVLIRKANTFIATIHGNQMDFFSAQTKAWQKSKSGRAYRRWMENWGIELHSDELPESWQGGTFENKAAAILQGLPNEPSA